MNPITWLIGWWHYSRIIVINVATLLFTAIPDIVSYLVGLDYDAFFQHEIAVIVGGFVNVLNIILRLNTIGPPGSRYVAPPEEPIMPDEPDEERSYKS